MARGDSKRPNNCIPAGTRFGDLVVVELVDEVRQSGDHIRYRCKCDCGGEKLVSGSNLKKGSVTSCGCKRWQSTSIVDKIPKMVRVMENGCWIWGKGKRGEHKKAWHKGRRVLVHRAMYEAFKGSIPDGLLVCHNCPGGDNPDCCNPEHLWLGTHAENLHDASIKGWYKKNRNRREYEKLAIECRGSDLGFDNPSDLHPSDG